MKNVSKSVRKLHASPLFVKSAREWMLSSALYDGIEDEDLRQIQTLLGEKGANPNVLLLEYGITPFHLVVANESVRFAVAATDICLQHGADPNVRSEDGLTPVHLAAMWGCPEVLHVLLASGGNPFLVDSLNKNAFDYALSEGQNECYNILNMCCKSEPKQSSHSKSPYQLNLKRVILYKNDLQIVYEASPSSSQKCASTQTSPSVHSNSVKDIVNGFLDKNNKYSETYNEKRNIGIENRNKWNFMEDYQNEPSRNISNKPGNHPSAKISNSTVSSKLKDIIIQHRGNSTIFEYSPSKDEEGVSSDVASWRDFPTISEATTGIVSELIEKLEQTNKIRQSMKSKEHENDLKMRNITHRKKIIQPILSQNSTREDSWHDLSSQNENEIVLNDSKASSSRTSNYEISATQDLNSPPSIGFILDNLDSNLSQTRGSSLFSDIASDIEVYTDQRQNMHDKNIMTEEENSSGERHLTKYSSSDSLYPYVSCNSENTREEDSNEYFESCFERFSVSEAHATTKTPPEVNDNNTTRKSYSVTKDVNSVMDCILTNIATDEKTPVNTNLVTSTPERLACGSERTSSMSNVEINTNPDKPKWVEAKVTFSSDEEPYLSISEEYEYTDMDEGVILIEKRYLLNDSGVSLSPKKKQGSKVTCSTSEESEISTISGSEGQYDTDEMRRNLQQYGFVPGPITSNTKRIYLRKLKRCRRKPVPIPEIGKPVFSLELMKTLEATCDNLLHEWSSLEDSMSASFLCARRQWREGQAKTSFTYLLLDPQLTLNMPASVRSVPHSTLWPQFLNAIFYVGKGKRSRPYAHLYKAVENWQKQGTCNSKKIQRILDIWKSGQGVVCLHVFLNIIPTEAFTREAAMICALTLPHLTNEKAGEFYGSASCWSLRLKRRLGCVLLHRAFKVFLAEGERQLRPADID